MKPKMIFLLFAVLPLCGLAQHAPNRDSAEAQIWKDECNDRVFSRVETPAVIKGGVGKMEDSLSAYLRSANIFHNGARIRLRFTVSAGAKILGIEKIENSFEHPELIEAFIRSHGNMWQPAVQNDRKVCAFTWLEAEIVADKLKVTTGM